MSHVVLLDAGPLSKVTHPKASENKAIVDWIVDATNRRYSIVVPEITDYELRRELIRANKTKSITRLDDFIRATGYLPLSTEIMRRAAEMWATIRNMGKSPCDDRALDADSILAAQAAVIAKSSSSVIIATENIGHLSDLSDARLWQDI